MAERSDKTTVIGERTKISGSLEGDEDLLIKGRVEGNVRLTKTLHVEAGGIVVADVNVKDCVVSGVVVGAVTATDSVHITDGGRMVGDINAPRVIIVAGAAFRGRVDMGDMQAERAAKPRAAAKAAPARVDTIAAVHAAREGKEEAPRPVQRAAAGRSAGGRPALAAVAPRIASAQGGKPPAPPAPPLPGGKKTLKKK